jgi:uncharacterized membrane protein
MDFVFFLGRFHVLVLHLPIGIILVAVAMQWMARKERHARLAAALPFLWGAAALTSIVTVVLGYMHFFEGGFTQPTAASHMISGTLIAVVAIYTWFVASRQPQQYARLGTPLAASLVVLLFVAGHYGGNLTHGSTYLVEYAPQPIRALAGLEPRRPRVTDVTQADPYLDLVRPMLRNRCSSCHGLDRQDGDLNLWTLEGTMRGGETGRAVLPGNATRSELYYRITLPESHEAFMPADGNTPLTATETAIVGWWIEAGALSDTTVGALDVPADVLGLMREWLRL